MANHIMYFKSQTIFKHYELWHINHTALKSWAILCDIFSKYNRASAFNQSKIGNEHAANFQNKMYSKFEKIEGWIEKKFRFSRVKIVKSNKLEKTEELIAGCQEVKCL